MTSVDSPNSNSEPPKGCNARAVVTPTPITARPTTHVGAAQHTTQVIVVTAAPPTSATQKVCALPLAVTTRLNADAAPMHAGRSRIPMTSFSHFGTARLL